MAEQSHQSLSTPAPAAQTAAPAPASAPRDTSNSARQEALRARMASAAPAPTQRPRPWWANLGGTVMDAVDGAGSAAMDLRDRALHGAVGAVTGAVGGAAERAGLPGVGGAVRGAGAAADHVIEFQSGLLRAGGNMASGAARLGVDTDAQQGLARTAYNATWLSDVGAARENDRRVSAAGGGAAARAAGALQTVAGRRVGFARGVGSGMVAHAATDWRSGHRMRAAGRVVGDVGSQLLGLGEAGGAARAGRVGGAAELGAAARVEGGAAAGARAAATEGAATHAMGAARPPMPVQQMPAVSVAQAQAGVMPRGFAAGPVSSRPVVSNPVGQMPAVSLADAQAGRLGPRNASHGPVGSAAPAPMEVHELPAVNPVDIAAGRAPAAGGAPVRRRPQAPTSAAAAALEPTLHANPALEPTLHANPALEPTLHANPALEPTLHAPAPIGVEPLPPLPAPGPYRWPPPPEVGPNPVVPNLPERTLPGQGAPATTPTLPGRPDPALEPTIRTDPALEPTIHANPALESTLHAPAPRPRPAPPVYPDPRAPAAGTARARSPQDYIKHWEETGHTGSPPKDGFDVRGGRVLPPGRPERVDNHVMAIGDAVREGRSAAPLPMHILGGLDPAIPAERAILTQLGETHRGSPVGDLAGKLARYKPKAE